MAVLAQRMAMRTVEPELTQGFIKRYLETIIIHYCVLLSYSRVNFHFLAVDNGTVSKFPKANSSTANIMLRSHTLQRGFPGHSLSDLVRQGETDDSVWC